MTVGGEFQTDHYILKGEGEEVWEPRFAYHGFQYVQVTGLPGKPALENITGCAVNTDFAPIGSFECSNELLNRLQTLTLWSYRGQFCRNPDRLPAS